MSLIEYPETGYNSWCDEDFAFEYFETRLNADAWDELSNKEPALMTAFRSINELNFDLVFDDDGLLSSDYSDSESETILTALKTAQLEQTLHELINDLDNPTISSLNLGGMLSVKIPTNQTPPSRYSERVLSILRPFIVARTVTRTR